MRTVEEIEAAIGELTHAEFLRLIDRLHVREQQEWDNRMDRDAASGKLDFLREETTRERKAGLLREWPATEK